MGGLLDFMKMKEKEEWFWKQHLGPHRPPAVPSVGQQSKVRLPPPSHRARGEDLKHIHTFLGTGRDGFDELPRSKLLRCFTLPIDRKAQSH